MPYQTKNPFIHGTNSTVLALLPHTNFSLFSPLWMIENYQLAPIHGELSKGGLDSSISESRLAFGRLNATSYDLEHISDNYAIKTLLPDAEQLINQAKNDIKRADIVLFSNINQIVIRVMRIKQYGIANDQWLTEAEQQTLQSKIESQIQLSYLLLLLGNKIHFDKEKIAILTNIEQRNDIKDAVFSYLTPELLLERICESKIDIKTIYENKNPLDSELQSVLDLLVLPEKCRIKPRLQKEKEVVLAETRVFTLKEQKKPAHPSDDSYDPKYMASTLLINREQIFADFMDALRNLSKDFLHKFHESILEHVHAMEHRFGLLQTILNKEPTNILDTPYKAFIEDSFPIFLICEDEEKLYSIGQEYRAKQPLKLGEDIKIILTDSAEHQQLVKNYLAEHNLTSVEVIVSSFVNETNVKKKQIQEIEDIFVEILKDNSFLMGLLRKNNNEDTLLHDYKKALLDELNCLPSRYDHPLRAARALAVLNDRTQEKDFLTHLDNFHKQAMDAKFYANTRVAASNLIVGLAIAALLGTVIGLSITIYSFQAFTLLLPMLIIAAFVSPMIINKVSDACADLFQLKACASVYKSKKAATSLGLLFQPTADKGFEEVDKDSKPSLEPLPC